MKVVILAGGLGTRISEESHLRPKPLIEIGDRPLIWHIMKHYSQYNFHEFIICCGYKGYMLKEYFSNYFLHCSDITLDFTNSQKMTIHNSCLEPWKISLIDTGLHTQTGGRLKRIQKYIAPGEDFFFTYGDGVSDIDLSKLLKTHHANKKTVTISAVRPSGRFGVLEIDEKTNAVEAFREKAVEDSTWINAGFMVMNSDIFNYIDDDKCILELEPLRKISAESKMGVHKHYGFWQCMDTQRDKHKLENLWATGEAPWKTW